MTLDLTCQACDTSFELDAAELLDEPRLQCPNCDARVPRAAAEGLSDALDGLLAQVARLAPRFGLVFEVESDDLPPPYDQGKRARAPVEDDEAADADDEELAPVDDEVEREVDE
jgi:hypothetical protein